VSRETLSIWQRRPNPPPYLSTLFRGQAMTSGTPPEPDDRVPRTSDSGPVCRSVTGVFDKEEVSLTLALLQ